MPLCCMNEMTELCRMEYSGDWRRRVVLLFGVLGAAVVVLGQPSAEVVEASVAVQWSNEEPLIPMDGYELDGVPFGAWEWETQSKWSHAQLLAMDCIWEPVDGLSDHAKGVISERSRADNTDEYWPHATSRCIHGVLQFKAPLVRYNPDAQVFEKLISFDGVWGEGVVSSVETMGQRQWDWPEYSVLSEGQLFRISIPKDGVYKLDQSFWSSIGIDASEVAPDQVTVFGNGGHLLPMDNSEERPLDPSTVALLWDGEAGAPDVSSGSFLFWGEGPNSITWIPEDQRFHHERNPYSDSAWYFVRIDDAPGRFGARMNNAPLLPVEELPDTVTTALHVEFHEQELHSPNRSGREWFGEEFGAVTQRVFSFPVPYATNEAGSVHVQMIARSIGGASTFEVSAGDVSEVLTPNTTSESSTANVANLASAMLEGAVISGSAATSRVDVNVEFSAFNASARGWLDYIRIEQEQYLRFSGVMDDFWGVDAGEGWARYEISNAGLVAQIWDITTPTQPQRLEFSITGDKASFNAPRNVRRRFVVMPNYGFAEPAVHGPLQLSNLHGWSDLDAVLITRPVYAEAASRWAAMRADEGLQVGVAFQQQVFNEFSSGQADPTALKMLMMMLRDRALESGGNPPRMLQLMGDGTFANRGGLSSSPYIITYQSENSLGPTSSYVSDDYFGFLEPEMGEDISDKMAIGVGRIPCSNAQEAMEFVEKLERYAGEGPPVVDACNGDEDQPEKGAWRNRICLVSDDMDGSGSPTELSHMMNSDEHANSLANEHMEFDVEKIYFDAYPQLSTPGGERYPDAAADINRKVTDGALIVNYIGHGGERGWAHERVLTSTMIRDWDNAYRMPLFMTATCELARFDDPEVESAGELMVLNPNGGAIGMLTTTRVVFSSSNQELNRAFYDVALEDEAFEDLRLGDIARITKNDPQVSNTSNKRNFTLLGDASMKLAYPQYEVVLSSMPDSVRALELFQGSGFIADANGDTLSSFNGQVTVRVFDKRSSITTLNNDGGSAPYAYSVFRNVIHQGESSVTNGTFEFEFMVPKDIDYTWGTGRVSCYALDVESGKDAHGASESWLIGGVNADYIPDFTPPNVDVYINDSLFVSGGITGAKPVLFVRAFDAGGINSAGSGIGHQMKAVIDGDWAGAVTLNDYYTSDLDAYVSGSITYPLAGMEPGFHDIQVVLWDVQNNQGTGRVEFQVLADDEPAFNVVTVYPNPTTDEVWFDLEHTLACEPAVYTLEVLEMTGRKVFAAEWSLETHGFRFEPLRWNLNDADGSAVKPGVYVCRITLQTTSGQVTQHSERIVVLRP